jgi:hypothetical protein
MARLKVVIAGISIYLSLSIQKLLFLPESAIIIQKSGGDH